MGPVGACLLLWVLSFGVGCQAEEGAEVAAEEEILPLREGEVVARVNGRAITRAELELAMKQSPGAQEDEVLEALIRLEVLAQEALERGLEQREDVRYVRDRALVQRLLELEVESKVGPESISAEEIEEVYQGYGLSFFKPELVTASHLLVQLPERSSADLEAKGKAVIDRVWVDLQRRLARGELNDEALQEWSMALNIQGYYAQAETDMTFTERPMAPLAGEVGYMAMVEPFAKAAFALSKEAPLSQPVRTRFGWHLILFKKRTPASRPSLPRVENLIKDELLLRARSRMLHKLIRRLASEAEIKTNEQALSELTGESPAAATP